MHTLRHVVLGLGLVSGLLGLSVACGSEGSGGSTPAGGGAGGFGATGGVGASGGVGATGGVGAAGGVGATGGTGNTGGVAGSGGTVNTGGTGTGGTGTGGAPTDGGVPADHILISEVGIEPGGAEFIEIYNPTSAEVDLGNYYLADNSAYHKITSGPWNPLGTAGTDWLVRFPAGTKLAAGGVTVVASEPAAGNSGFFAIFGKCPNFTINSTATALSCGTTSVPAMLIPPNGSVGANKGALISNDREMIVLFTWDGAASIIEDVDYVTWGTSFDDNTRVDKSAVSGYKPDTARGSQKSASQGVAADGGGTLAIERCALETGEKLAGGNGATGHDETSEDMGTSFKTKGTPSPGAKNPCLP